MGHSTSSQECVPEAASSPSSLLWVKVQRGTKLQTPTALNGDNVLKICRWLQGKPHRWRMYVRLPRHVQ